MKSPWLYLSICFSLSWLAEGQAQDHGHLNVGAVARTQDAKLSFDNGSDFAIASSYVKTLNFASTGKFAGVFEGNITLTALHANDAFGDPVPEAPLPGSFVVAEIVSVEGPRGGQFQFWETNSTTAPAFSIPVETRNGEFRFELSEAALGAGEPGGDPYGHIHGRRFSATVPGLYAIGFRAIDTSSNGASGGPLHSPSDVLVIHFQAGVNITKLETQEDGVRVSLAAPAGFTWQLRSSDHVPGADGTDVGAPVTGTDTVIEIEDARPLTSCRVYWAVGTPATP
jgi:hypothetical protein